MALPGLLDDLTLFENVAFRLRRENRPETEVVTRVQSILKEFGLAESTLKLPLELSGGMRRRGALARALVHEPSCLLLDDPTAGLDPITASNVIRFILHAASSRGAAVLLTTHDLKHVAARADEVWKLDALLLRRLSGGPEQWATELGT